MLRKSTFVAFLCLCFGVINSFSQTPTIQEKKRIKVQLWVNGKLHPVNQTLTKQDADVKIRAYNADTNQELAVIAVEAAVVRNGQKLQSLNINGGGSIDKLINKVKNDDKIVFEITQIYELAADMSLKPFTTKSFKVSYLFFDAGLDSPKVATIGSN